ncbi:MAG: hypothetical protein DAHOPDDO_01504 [Ignavibacteriaceae bacterium]|jgi:hypothetical protein|nr:hypothetical protein [Ignavibacteriaceae bacterium]GIK61282.1 MAG: hypothetical protein BroJett017_21720 [Ignavibacteriota bacterium]GJQ42138.1 MAG: hypothetical protein JETCAE03_16360 [Ignavibacteriaceae bacterium]
MIVIILRVKTISAKIPNGCDRNEEIISPLNRKEIEFPNPHPGQNSNPRLARGQIVKCVSPGE